MGTRASLKQTATIAAVHAVVALSAVRPAAGQERPIDRWLLSRPFAASSVPEEGPLPTVAELNPLFAPGGTVPPAPSQLEEDVARADSILGRPRLPEGRDPLDPSEETGREEPGETRRQRPPRGPPQQQSPLRPSWMARRDSVLFPERGVRVGATIWTLIRQDGNPTFNLDTLVSRSGATATFAHAYLRPPADQTVKISFTSLGCTAITARLNEQPIALPAAPESKAPCPPQGRTVSAPVRLAGGWNALLVKAEGDAAPYGFSVTVAPGPDGEGIQDLRIQASRPPGIRPILPDPWIDIMSVRVPMMQWRGDVLAAEVEVDFQVWGYYPPEGAEAQLRVGDEDAEHRFSQEPGGGIETVYRLVPLEELRQAALSRGVVVELAWEDVDRDLARAIPIAAILDALHEPIRLVGWTGVGGNLPGEGDVLSGEWEVPGWLSGFTLQLVTEGSPGDYSLDGQPLAPASSGGVLCRECPKDVRLRLGVAATGEWSSMPGVRIAGPAYRDAESAEGSPPPERWLRALEKGGTEDYRQLLAEYADTGDGS